MPRNSSEREEKERSAIDGQSRVQSIAGEMGTHRMLLSADQKCRGVLTPNQFWRKMIITKKQIRSMTLTVCARVFEKKLKLLSIGTVFFSVSSWPSESCC